MGLLRYRSCLLFFSLLPVYDAASHQLSFSTKQYDGMNKGFTAGETDLHPEIKGHSRLPYNGLIGDLTDSEATTYGVTITYLSTKPEETMSQPMLKAPVALPEASKALLGVLLTRLLNNTSLAGDLLEVILSRCRDADCKTKCPGNCTALNEENGLQHDHKGAAMFSVVVICLYGFSILLMMASVVNRNKHDRDAHNFIKISNDGRFNRKLAAEKARMLMYGRPRNGAIRGALSTWSMTSFPESEYTSQMSIFLPLNPNLPPVGQQTIEEVDDCSSRTSSAVDDRSHGVSTVTAEEEEDREGDGCTSKGADNHSEIADTLRSDPDTSEDVTAICPRYSNV